MTYITTYLDPSAGMEVMFWRDIRAMFMDAVYVRHNSRTLDFLKDANGNTLVPLRVAALPRAVMEIVVDAPLNPPVAHALSRVVTPLTPRSAPPSAMYRRPPPATPHVVPRPPVLPGGQQTPRPTARSIMGRIVPHINLVQLQGKGEGDKNDFPKFLECYLKAVYKGHAYAQFAVGKLYSDGKNITHNSHFRGVAQDYAKAMKCEQDATKNTRTDSFSRQETLEEPDLRHLEVFIKSKEQDRALGNLYRIIIEEGYVKWVCINHYRLAYKGQDQQDFANAVAWSHGHYDPHFSRVTVRLESKFQAAGFFEALAKARRVDELAITFDWEGTKSDLETIGDILENAVPASNLQSTYTLQQALARYTNLPSMKMIHIGLPMDVFLELSHLQPKWIFSPPKLSFELVSRQGGIGRDELGKITHILKTGSTLTTLNLTGNSIKQNGAMDLSDALMFNSTLTTLDLSNNWIKENGAVALSEALKTNFTLTTLNLSYNSIRDSGAVALSGALNTNSTLTTLNLTGNTIGNKGTVALSEALKTNLTLTTLDLTYNWIKEEGAIALSEVLKTNSTLSTLDLTGNTIGNKGTILLKQQHLIALYM
ncbi:hypothetical protein BGZ95_007162 [Linnemannia exigua]|uniref:RNI-like protein n=1 Tax=Linnemannia exigua TaxID=604196 RepID=A0AAD4DHJ5_9FUNG|nr:hypothetical protein BGZ95_007162 [Linnemannia exigua]